jgi:hypothetical protein
MRDFKIGSSSELLRASFKDNLNSFFLKDTDQGGNRGVAIAVVGATELQCSKL